MRKLALSIIAALMLTVSVQSQELDPPVVAISAQQFVFTPDVVRVERSAPVTLRITSTDRIHRFTSHELGFNVDIQANQPRDITIVPVKRGRYVATGDTGHGFTHLVIDVE